MLKSTQSIRSFIGAQNYAQSQSFYQDFGFALMEISEKLSYMSFGSFGFYLQDYYVKDWVENSMLLLEVQDLESFHTNFVGLGLAEKYDGVRISEIQANDWGNEFFVHDPSGVLWIIAEFKKIPAKS